MAYHRKKDPVPDPAHYDSLISDRIKCARQDPDSPEKWMELGLLCEARIEMIKDHARGIPLILKRALKGEYILSEYNDFLDQIRIQFEITVEKDFLNKLETVAKRYRNTITHESPMSKRGCEHLRDLVFAGDNALLKTCAALTR